MWLIVIFFVSLTQYDVLFTAFVYDLCYKASSRT